VNVSSEPLPGILTIIWDVNTDSTCCGRPPDTTLNVRLELLGIIFEPSVRARMPSTMSRVRTKLPLCVVGSDRCFGSTGKQVA